MVCPYHTLFIHSSVDRHLDCLHLLAIVNKVAAHIGVQIAVQIPVSILLGIDLEVEFLDHLIILCSIFLGTTKLFSTAAVQISDLGGRI